MATNDFLTFAGDPAANVMTQANYLATGFTARLLGFSTGTALSIQLNKVWRQASLISTMIGQFTCDEINQDMLDDGTPGGMAALQTHFRNAVTHVAQGAIGVGYLPLTGGSLSGPLTVNAQVSLNAPAGQWSSFTMSRQAGMGAQLAAYTSGTLRWTTALATAEPEVGANSGSNFAIASFTDAGAYLDTPMSINRATGVVNFSHNPTIGGGAFPYVRLSGDTMTGPLSVGSTGVAYTGMGSAPWYHRSAFGWDGSFLIAAVDGTYIGQLATVGWSSSLVGNYLPLAGGVLSGALTVNASFVVAGSSGFRSSVWFSNLGDFSNFYDGRSRYRQWAGNWWDAWDGATGNRTWYCAGGQSMFLDGVANWQVTGAARSYGGRLISISGSFAPSVGAWWTGGVAKGFWVDGSGLWFGQMDANANPTSGQMLVDNNGYITLYGSGQCNGNWWVGGNIHSNTLDTSSNINCSGTAYINYSQIWGNETVNGQFLAGGQIISNSNVIAHGSMQCDNTLNVNGGGYAGYWRSYGNVQADGNFTGGGIFVNYVRSYGDMQADNNFNCNNWIHGNRLMAINGGDANICAWSTGNGNCMGFQTTNQMNIGYFDGGGNWTGTIIAALNSSSFVIANPVKLYYNPYAASDISLKTNIVMAPDFDSLGAIIRTPIRSFDWAHDKSHVANGMIAQELEETMPDVITICPIEPSKGLKYVDTQAVVAHLFRAIRQLNDKIESMAHV